MRFSSVQSYHINNSRKSRQSELRDFTVVPKYAAASF